VSHTKGPRGHLSSNRYNVYRGIEIKPIKKSATALRDISCHSCHEAVSCSSGVELTAQQTRERGGGHFIKTKSLLSCISKRF